METVSPPESLLPGIRELLKPKGFVLFWFDNALHLSRRLLLLSGKWPCPLNKPQRWLTRALVLRALTLPSFQVCRWSHLEQDFDVREIPVAPQIYYAVRPFLEDEEQQIRQHIVLAQPVDSTELARQKNKRFQAGQGLRVLCVLPTLDLPLVQIRIINPLNEWVRIYGGRLRFRTLSSTRPQDLRWAQTLVLQRGVDRGIWALIQRAQRLGKRLVFDIDDLLTEVPDFLPQHRLGLRRQQLLEKALSQVDAVTVRLRSTSFLSVIVCRIVTTVV